MRPWRRTTTTHKSNSRPNRKHPAHIGRDDVGDAHDGNDGVVVAGLTPRWYGVSVCARGRLPVSALMVQTNPEAPASWPLVAAIPVRLVRYMVHAMMHVSACMCMCGVYAMHCADTHRCEVLLVRDHLNNKCSNAAVCRPSHGTGRTGLWAPTCTSLIRRSLKKDWTSDTQAATPTAACTSCAMEGVDAEWSADATDAVDGPGVHRRLGQLA